MHNSQHHMCAAGALFMYLTCMNVCAIYIHTYIYVLFVQKPEQHATLLPSPSPHLLPSTFNSQVVGQRQRRDYPHLLCPQHDTQTHTHTTETTIHTCSMLLCRLKCDASGQKERESWLYRRQERAREYAEREWKIYCTHNWDACTHMSFVGVGCAFVSCLLGLLLLCAKCISSSRAKPNRIAQTQSASTIRVQHIIPFLTYTYREQYVNSKTCFGQEKCIEKNFET